MVLALRVVLLLAPGYYSISSMEAVFGSWTIPRNTSYIQQFPHEGWREDDLLEHC
jgi:hypothetical protein